MTALCLHVDTICGGDDLWMESRAVREQTVIRVLSELFKVHGVVGASHLIAM
jgi:hypothetical protein